MHAVLHSRRPPRKVGKFPLSGDTFALLTKMIYVPGKNCTEFAELPNSLPEASVVGEWFNLGAKMCIGKWQVHGPFLLDVLWFDVFGFQWT